MNKKKIFIIIGLLIVIIGTFLPSIKIAMENISFIKENCGITLVLILISLILFILNKEDYIAVSSSLFIYLVIKFLIDNKIRLDQIMEVYNCYAKYRYGLLVILIGNIVVILTVFVSKFDIVNLFKRFVMKVCLFFSKVFQKVAGFFKNIFSKEKIIGLFGKIKKSLFKLFGLVKSFVFKIVSKIKCSRIKVVNEKTKDLSISYRKMTVKCNRRESFFSRLKFFFIKFRIKKARRKISISSYSEERPKIHHKNGNFKVYSKYNFDIRRWTRSNVCCANCGATISTTSDYCFLCDCKIKFSSTEAIH